MKKILSALMLGLLGMSGAIAGNVQIVNPSFELASENTPLTDSLVAYNASSSPYGWTLQQGNIEAVNASYWAPQQGAYSIDMNGVGSANATLSQSISGFTTGNSYSVLFGLSWNKNGISCPEYWQCQLMVSIAGVSKYYDVGYSAQGWWGWTDEVFTFTANAETLTLEFQQTAGNPNSNGGPAIDNIRVLEAAQNAVPEPGSLALLGFGLLTLNVLRRRLV